MADDRWAGERGVVRLPGGELVRGRRLADDVPPADFALDGLSPGEAVRWVRRAHHLRAVETPWQRWWLHSVR